jgi:hypothetical protein
LKFPPEICSSSQSFNPSLYPSFLLFEAIATMVLIHFRTVLALALVSSAFGVTTSSSSVTTTLHTSTTSTSSSSSSSSSSSLSVSVNAVASESVAPVNAQGAASAVAAPAVPLASVTASNGVTLLANTSSSTNAKPAAAVAVSGSNVKSTILVIARDSASAYSAYSGLNGYGIPYQLLIVPQAGASLPVLNSSTTAGNFGAIVILSEVSYDYGTSGGGFQSALTTAQWSALYTYQISFGVRMVRLDVYPSEETGTEALGGCCDTGVEQLVSISNNAKFPTAGMKTGAGMSTAGIWHYPATITNSTIATEIAQFAATTGFSKVSTAAVINNFSGRQQMVFYLGFSTDWSPTSNFLQHAWIHWSTRGLYAGYRRVGLNTQIDDMFLESDIYSPAGNTFRIRTGDLAAHKTWMPTVQSKMPSGSSYFIEVGHNGNGNIEAAYNLDTTGKKCAAQPIEYDDQNSTALEFQKPLGTGTDIWPATASDYPNYSTACMNLDTLKTWWATAANRDAFAHVSHTFTHEDQDNATYNDIFREISWNQAWLSASTIASGSKFSSKGLIPPAITGLHNGDALRAWATRGIVNAVGDNTRPALLNTQNEHWPLITTVAANGYAGIQITPRWATNIYYNCDTPACTVAEWIATSAGSGDISTLLALEKADNTRHLLGLRRDPFMFHQANLRQTDASKTVVNGVSSQFSLLQMWVETVAVEMARIVTWPLVTLKHDDLAAQFAARVARDACTPNIAYQLSPTAKTVTGVVVTTTGNTCSVTIPVTVPGSVTNTQGFTTEKIGSDPTTIWVKMSGSPVTFTLSTPVAW